MLEDACKGNFRIDIGHMHMLWQLGVIAKQKCVSQVGAVP